jgi:hypothetical protein
MPDSNMPLKTNDAGLRAAMTNIRQFRTRLLSSECASLLTDF